MYTQTQHAPATLDPEAMRKFVESIRQLPLFSPTALQLMRSVEQEDVTATQLGKLIAVDVALVVHLLRIVNSPYYGLARQVGTVVDAIAVIGMNTVRRIVTAAVLQRPLMAYIHDSADARAFWRHSLTCAGLARHLAQRKSVNGEVAYMAGLMHDVGRLAMLKEFRDDPQVGVLTRSDPDDYEPCRNREVRAFGFDHASVGGQLLDLWGLPAAIVNAARQHEDEPEPEDPLSASVWHANLISHAMIDETLGDEDGKSSPWMTTIGLSAKAWQEISREIEAIQLN